MPEGKVKKNCTTCTDHDRWIAIAGVSFVANQASATYAEIEEVKLMPSEGSRALTELIALAATRDIRKPKWHTTHVSTFRFDCRPTKVYGFEQAGFVAFGSPFLGM